MSRLFETVSDLNAQRDVLRRRAYGVIEVIDERFARVRLRPFPKRMSLVELWVAGRWHHSRRRGNRCLLYYNQPRSVPDFLSLVYVASAAGTTLKTLRTALAVLDEIARLKGSDALVCDVANSRISDRLLARWGWQSHCPRRWHRHFIKRF